VYTRDVRTHELKTWPEPFQATWDGIKLYEFRKNDRGFEVGDQLELREYDPLARGGKYTGRFMRALVVYMSEPPDFGFPNGYVIMGLRRTAFVDQDHRVL